MAITARWVDENDFIEEFGERDLPVDDDGDLNIDKLNKSIDDAILLIESYLKASNVSMPLNLEIQRELTNQLMNITRYYYSNNTGSITEEIRIRYKDAIDYLVKIANGTVKISSSEAKTGLRQIPLFRV